MRRIALALMVVAGCGDDGGNNSKTDASIDDAEIDMASTQPVTIRVTAGTTALANVRVHFQNTDSSVISSTMTGTDGRASAMMPSGGYVTAINPYANAPGEVFTFVSPKPGDELLLDAGTFGSSTMYTTTGAIDTDSNVSFYRVATACGSDEVGKVNDQTAPVWELYIDSRCLPNVDFLVESLDNNGNVIHWGYTAAKAVSGSTIDLSAVALTGTPTTKLYTYNNVPASINSITTLQLLSTAQGDLFEQGAGTSGDPLSSSISVPAFTGARDVVASLATFAYGLHGVAQWSSTFSNSYTVDVGASHLVQASSAAMFDTATHKITWSEATGGIAPDFVIVDMSASRSNLEIEWSLTGPYTPGAIQFPTLPVEGGVDLNFSGTDSVVIGALLLAKIPGGYDLVRENVFAGDGPFEIGTTAMGSLTIEFVGDPNNPRTVAPPSARQAVRKAVSPAWMPRRRM